MQPPALCISSTAIRHSGRTQPSSVCCAAPKTHTKRPRQPCRDTTLTEAARPSHKSLGKCHRRQLRSRQLSPSTLNASLPHSWLMRSATRVREKAKRSKAFAGHLSFVAPLCQTLGSQCHATVHTGQSVDSPAKCSQRQAVTGDLSKRTNLESVRQQHCIQPDLGTESPV